MQCWCQVIPRKIYVSIIVILANLLSVLQLEIPSLLSVSPHKYKAVVARHTSKQMGAQSSVHCPDWITWDWDTKNNDFLLYCLNRGRTDMAYWPNAMFKWSDCKTVDMSINASSMMTVIICFASCVFSNCQCGQAITCRTSMLVADQQQFLLWYIMVIGKLLLDALCHLLDRWVKVLALSRTNKRWIESPTQLVTQLVYLHLF